jgi:hypothetical protein
MLILPPSMQPSSRKPVRKHSTRAFPSGVEAPPRKAARTLVPIGCGQLSNGQAAAPPTSVMKSRRLTGCPFSRRRYSTMLRMASRQILTADVRYGSKADILGALRTSFVCGAATIGPGTSPPDSSAQRPRRFLAYDKSTPSSNLWAHRRANP